MDERKCVILLSGGQDSTTCLFWAKKHFKEVHAVTINYGQKHDIEIEAARKVAGLVGVDSHEFVDVGPILSGTSPLVNPDYEVEQYKDVESLPGGVENTFVPGRNILFLTIVANKAYCLGVQNIVIGVSEEDFGGYFDCREEFIDKMDLALNSGLYGVEEEPWPLVIQAPLLHLNKKETVELAQILPGCIEALKYSHTCYNGVFPPCGKCHACILRENGFKQAGIVDPIQYRSVDE